MLKNKFLLYPLIVFFGLFLIDKFFLLEIIKKYIKPDATYIYYEAKQELLEKVIQKYKNQKPKKLMIILGSSRLLYFSYKDLTDFYPDWDIINFSSAVTSPPYYYYILSRLLENGIKPDFILLETAPNQFNLNNSSFKSFNLTYSFDLQFVLANSFTFGREYVTYYIGKKMFAVSKNKPDLQAFWKNINNENFTIFETLKQSIRQKLLEENGHSPSPIEEYVERDSNILESTSERSLGWLFSNYKPDEVQFDFYKKLLRLATKNKLEMMIILPEGSPYLEKRIAEYPFVKEWKKQITEINQIYDQKMFDLKNEKNYTCNAYSDGGHISKECYRALMRFVMIKYYEEKYHIQEKI